jgi:TPR repeat protein
VALRLALQQALQRALWLALALSACGSGERATSGEDAIREALARDGMTDITIVEQSDDGAHVVAEATRGAERCTVQITQRAGTTQRAMQCAPSEAIEVVERDCEAGDAARCAEAAARLRATGTVDWPRATRASVRACEGSEPRECLHVGMAHELGGRGLPVDPQAAARMYARACDAGSPAACQRR